VNGTPSFFINGKKVDAGSWEQLEPLLKAAGAR
jgi:protein-disulfide isomerase